MASLRSGLSLFPALAMWLAEAEVLLAWAHRQAVVVDGMMIRWPVAMAMAAGIGMVGYADVRCRAKYAHGQIHTQQGFALKNLLSEILVIQLMGLVYERLG